MPSWTSLKSTSIKRASVSSTWIVWENTPVQTLRKEFVLPDLWTLTCAPGSRADEAARIFRTVVTPGVLVTTQPDPVPQNFMYDVEVVLFDDTEINISKWWTLGLDRIAS